jgi:Tol biopolymer transport system component
MKKATAYILVIFLMCIAEETEFLGETRFLFPMCIASAASETTDEHFDKARTLLNDARYAEVAEEFKAIVKLEPDGSEIAQNARYWVGQCYFRIEQFDEALAIFEKLIVEYPKSAIVPVTKLMIGQVQQEKENAKRRARSNTDNGVIIDPKTGVEYTRTTSLVGKSDVIKYTTTGFSLSPDGRFLLWEARVIPLDGSEPFNLVDMPASRGYWSPDMKQIAFCSGSSTWVIPVSPETGRPTGPAKKLLDYHAQVTWSPDSEKIAFLYGAMIRAISIKDGSQSQIVHDTLTSHADWRYDLSWSKDGKNLAYSAYSDGRWNIWLCSTDGGAAIKTVETDRKVTPFWSHDGHWILYTTYDKLHFFHIPEKREFSISLPKELRFPTTFIGPSPDGKKMLFYQPSYDSKYTLKVASSSGGPSLELGRQLTLWGDHYFWSPDSKIIVADGETKEGEPALWIIPLASGDPFPLEMKVSVPSLTGQVGGKVYPRGLSPDCNKLLFFTEQAENTDLWVVPVSLKDGKTTGKAVNVFSGWKGIPVVGEHIWSPNGKEIVLIHKGDVWIAYADGSEPVQRTNNPDIEFFPSWSPDGKMIAYDRQGSLWVIPASGGEARKPPGVQGAWAWSPNSEGFTVADGKSISVVSISDGKTREIRDLKDLEFVSVEEMCWSPDGKHLALIADYNAEYDPEKSKPSRIFVFPVEGGKVTQIASDDDSVFKVSLSWSPDGKWVSYNTEEEVKTRPEATILEANMDELLKKCQVTDWAGKWQPSTSRYCYAKFRDATTDAIRSDGCGQYADYNILDSNLPNGRGEDRVEVFFQGNDFLKLFLYVGRMQWYYNPAPASSRRTEFHFNIGQPTHKFDDYQDNKAVFDILKKYKDGDAYVDRDLNNPRSIHIPITIYKNDADGNDWIQFVVDPNPLSPPKPPPQIDATGTDPRAITQAKVDDFYPDDANIDYWDTGQNGWENNQIVYFLDYGPQGFKVEPILDSNGNQVTWVFTTNNIEPVKLYVYNYRGGTVYLAQYDAVPFQFAVSVNSLADFSFSDP